MAQMEPKTAEEIQELVSGLAKQNFKTGFNCAEAVLRACIDGGLLPQFPPEIVALSSGFGGGIGMTKHTCGAVSGAVMAVGGAYGRENPAEREEMAQRVQQLQKEVYPAFRAMVEEFKEQYGSITCSELTNPHGDFEGKERKRSCMQMITFAAGLAAKYLSGGRE